MERDVFNRTKANLIRSSASTAVFSKMFFDHHLTRPYSKMHYKALRTIDDPTLRYVLLLAFREMGKSTMSTLFYLARLICWRKARFIAMISQTEKKAKKDLKTLQNELAYNPEIRRYFGQLRPHGRDANWTKEEFTTTTGVTVLARGADQQIRGFKEGESRPDIYLCDDFEDPKEARSETGREQRKDTFWADIYNSQAFGVSRFRYLATPLHYKALSVDLLRDPEWRGLRFEMCNKHFVSNWPEYITDEQCREQAELWRKRGRYHIWLMEKRCVLHDPTTLGFKTDMMRTMPREEIEAMINEKQISFANFVMMDPGRCLDPKGSATAIVGGTLNYTHRKVHWWYVQIGHWKPTEAYRRYVDAIKYLKTLHYGAEDHGLHEHIKEPLLQYMRGRKVHREPTWLKPRGRQKEDRAGTMLPFFEIGAYVMTPEFKAEVERPMLEWPHTDWQSDESNAFDVMGYLTQLLNVEKVILGVTEEELLDQALLARDREDPEREPRVSIHRGPIHEVAKLQMETEPSWEQLLVGDDGQRRAGELLEDRVDRMMAMGDEAW